jgi:dipeptidyl aminopeptidase/acylaminoacyl peptidase
MDDRGFGESGGGTEGVTSRDYADDIRAGLAFLRARPEIDGSRLALLGHSEGGLIAPLVAATDPGLAGIVLLAGPAYTGRRIIEFQNRYGIEQRANIPPDARDSAVRAAMRTVDSAAASQPWMTFFLDYDPLPTARTIKVPVLILQGATDQQVTPDQAPLLADAFKAGGNPDVTLRIFPATNHLFLADPDGSPFKYQTLTPATMRPEVLQAIGDWLTRRLFR